MNSIVIVFLFVIFLQMCVKLWKGTRLHIRLGQFSLQIVSARAWTVNQLKLIVPHCELNGERKTIHGTYENPRPLIWFWLQCGWGFFASKKQTKQHISSAYTQKIQFNEALTNKYSSCYPIPLIINLNFQYKIMLRYFLWSIQTSSCT
jgi:hypothetical protein